MKLDVTTEEGYLIAVALNGPGLNILDSWKWIVTARIRHACAAHHFRCSVRSTPITGADTNEAVVALCTAFAECDSAAETVAAVLHHWAAHAILAADRLGLKYLVPVLSDLSVLAAGFPADKLDPLIMKAIACKLAEVREYELREMHDDSD